MYQRCFVSVNLETEMWWLVRIRVCLLPNRPPKTEQKRRQGALQGYALSPSRYHKSSWSGRNSKLHRHHYGRLLGRKDSRGRRWCATGRGVRVGHRGAVSIPSLLGMAANLHQRWERLSHSFASDYMGYSVVLGNVLFYLWKISIEKYMLS